MVWEVSIDSSTARAHQHASGARRRPSQADEKRVIHPADERLGRSRGGLTTKFHLACDGKGRLLSVVMTAGQRHDSTQLAALLDGIRVLRPGGRGRPRTRSNRLIADKGYISPRCRRLLRQRHIPPTIPVRSDQRARRAKRLWRPLAFEHAVDARRNVVGRALSRLKPWRGLVTRYEKRAVN
jgi:transposase